MIQLRRLINGVAMSTYIVAQINIHNRKRYADYEAGFGAVFAQFDGKMLAVDESPAVVEGHWPYTRTVIIEFPSAKAANAWYKSEAYQTIAAHRLNASVANIVFVEGGP